MNSGTTDLQDEEAEVEIEGEGGDTAPHPLLQG
jgi:hypothetical protein